MKDFITRAKFLTMSKLLQTKLNLVKISSVMSSDFYHGSHFECCSPTSLDSIYVGSKIFFHIRKVEDFNCY